MAKTVSKKSLEVKTPYPNEAKVKKDDINYLGNKLADLSDRINEVELSMESLGRDIKRVMGRMGL
jgi:hypothetical protein